MEGKISNFAQKAYLRRYTLTDGQEAGLRIIEADNGKLRFLLNESKALDIAQLWHGGENVSFLSKAGLTARELPFLSRFEGGMVYTCGLDSVGAREGFELHGTLHNTPARVTRAECTEEGIAVEAEIRVARLFGENLVLKRRVHTKIGSETLELCDTLENIGCRDERYCLLYHVNIGYPMLSEGSEIVMKTDRVTPRNAWAEQCVNEMNTVTAPVPERPETCYFLGMAQPRATLVNSNNGKSFTLEYSKESLPHFVLWKSMAHGDYALGFEPATTELDERFAYSTLKAQSSADFSLKLTVKNN